jgi:hypothetical protein
LSGEGVSLRVGKSRAHRRSRQTHGGEPVGSMCLGDVIGRHIHGRVRRGAGRGPRRQGWTLDTRNRRIPGSPNRGLVIGIILLNRYIRPGMGHGRGASRLRRHREGLLGNNVDIGFVHRAAGCVTRLTDIIWMGNLALLRFLSYSVSIALATRGSRRHTSV